MILTCACRSASLGSTVPASCRYISDIKSAVTSSWTTHWLTTTPAAPAAKKAHPSPTGSAVPPSRPDSHALKVTTVPVKSRSNTSAAVSHRSASRNEENSGFAGRYRPWQAMCTTPGPGTAPRNAAVVAPSPTSTRARGRNAATAAASRPTEGACASGTANTTGSPVAATGWGSPRLVKLGETVTVHRWSR